MSVRTKIGLWAGLIGASTLVVLAGAAPSFGQAPVAPVVPAAPLRVSPVLTVTKVVQGSAPSTATFTVHVDCGTAGAFDLNFGSTGGSQSIGTGGSPDLFGKSCDVTETPNQSGGAGLTSFTCSDNSATGSSYCAVSIAAFALDAPSGIKATITVTNTFFQPAPVVAPARFTG